MWIAQALWVTHVAGAAAMLVDALTTDRDLPPELGVARFVGADPATLREGALRPQSATPTAVSSSRRAAPKSRCCPISLRKADCSPPW